MVNRGGGVTSVRSKILKSSSNQFIVVELLINVCDSMGANIVNTIV